MDPVLRADGLVKSVGSGRARRRVLDGVSLTVAADEIVAVLGRSGSGKSTLLNLLGGLDEPDAGEITLAGERLTGRSARALARARLRHVGFVFQQFQLIEECTGIENVLMPTRLPGAPPGGARRGRAADLRAWDRGGGRPSPARALGRRAAAVRARPRARQRSRAGARRRADRQPRCRQRRRRARAAARSGRPRDRDRHPRARSRRRRRSRPASDRRPAGDRAAAAAP